MYLTNLKSVALPVPQIIAIEFLGGAANPQSWGGGGRKGSHTLETNCTDKLVPQRPSTYS